MALNWFSWAGGVSRRRRPLPASLSAVAGIAVFLIVTTAVTANTTAIAPAAAASASVDLKVNVAGPTSGEAGGAFTYTVTVANNSLPDASGASVTNSVPASATGVAATCASSGGAECPSALTVSNATVSGSVGALPHLGVVQLTITGHFGVPSPSSVTDSAGVSPPSGETDSDPTGETSSVSTALDNTADLQATLTQDSATISADVPVTYTTSVTNAGPAAADGAAFSVSVPDGRRPSTAPFDHLTLHVVSCSGTDGVACPSFVHDNSSNSDVGFNGTLPSFPSGATLSIVYQLTASDPEECGYGATDFSTDAEIDPPAGINDPNPGDNSSYVDTIADASPDCPRVPEADLQTTLSQTASTTSDASPDTYTLIATNTGPDDSGGANLSDDFGSGRAGISPYDQIDVHVVSCTLTGATGCPSFIQDGTSTGSVFDGTIPDFPSGAVLSVVYEVTLVGQPPCGEDPMVYDTDATISSADGIDDPDADNNNSSIGTSTDGTPACPPNPRADLRATMSASASTTSAADPVTMTVTVSNQGPDAADGAALQESFGGSRGGSRPYDHFALHVLSCAGTGGVDCPASIADDVGAGSVGFQGNLSSFPSGAVLTIVYQVTPVDQTNCGYGPVNFSDYVGISVPDGIEDPDLDDNAATADVYADPESCNDVAVNEAISPAQARAGDSVTTTTTVTNATTGDVGSVVFTDPLPTGFIYSGSSCQAVDAVSECGPMSFDPGTGVLSSVITLIGESGGAVVVTVSGTAGPVPGNYLDSVTAVSSTGPDAFIDPIPTSNTSTVSIQIFNTSSHIVVTKVLGGAPVAGFRNAITFTGLVSCEDQDPQPWTATVPAGATSASAPAVVLYDGEPCTITEDPDPTAPAGYDFVGQDTISPTAIAELGPSTTTAVTSTSTLAELPSPALAIVAAADPSTASTLGRPIRFLFTVTNTGNVPVSAVGIADSPTDAPSIAELDVSCPESALDPGESMTCATAAYALTQTDLDAGQIADTATAVGTDPQDNPVLSAPATATVSTTPTNGISLSVDVNGSHYSSAPGKRLCVGDTVVWTYVVTNTGTSILTHVALAGGNQRRSPIQFPDSFSGTLDPGESVIVTTTGHARRGLFEEIAHVTAIAGDPVVVSATDRSWYTGSELPIVSG